jgi:hypothetical protein
MAEDNSKTKIVRGVDSPDGLRNLTRVTESQLKKTGSNPEPQTVKPVNFSPPGQGPAAPSPSKPGQTPSESGSDGSAD